jgi:DNA-binding Lrp family transcriptional regulator
MEKVWDRAIINQLSETDVKVLNYLTKPKNLSEDEIEKIANELKITKEEVKKSIKKLKEKNIIVAEKVTTINPLNVFDRIYLTFLKVRIEPPIYRPPDSYPTGWESKFYVNEILKIDREILKTNIVRAILLLKGTEWDILMITYTNSLEELTKLCSKIAQTGWVKASHTVTVIPISSFVEFEPINFDYDKEYKEGVLKWFK